MIDQSVDGFLTFCRNFDQALLITEGQLGLAARPMMIAEIDEYGSLWFATDIDSGKVEDIENNPNVCITMAGLPGHVFIKGHASVVRNSQQLESLWNESWREWFPKGPSDARLVLLKVDTNEGDYWSAAGTSGTQYYFKSAGAYSRSERIEHNANVPGQIAM